MSVILTNKMRDEIVDKAVRGAMVESEKRISAARTHLADALYAATVIYIEPGAELIAAKDAGPRWVNYSANISIGKHPDFRFYWQKGTDQFACNCELQMSAERPFPKIGSKGWVGEDEDEWAKHPVFQEATSVAKLERDAWEMERELRAKLKQMLTGYRRLDKLRKEWPEGAQYLPTIVATTKTAVVPANLVNEVNQLLGLVSTDPD